MGRVISRNTVYLLGEEVIGKGSAKASRHSANEQPTNQCLHFLGKLNACPHSQSNFQEKNTSYTT